MIKKKDVKGKKKDVKGKKKDAKKVEKKDTASPGVVENVELSNLDDDVLVGDDAGEKLEEIAPTVASIEENTDELFSNGGIVGAIAGEKLKEVLEKIKLEVKDFSTMYINRIPHYQKLKQNYPECLIITRSQLDYGMFEVNHLRHDTSPVLNKVGAFWSKIITLEFCDNYEFL